MRISTLSRIRDPRIARSFLLVVGLMLGWLAQPALSRDQIQAESRLYAYSGQLSACESPSILGQIQDRFAETESRYWQSEVRILDLGKIEESSFRPNGTDFIPRRYCLAEALLSNQQRTKVHYAIIEDTGWFSFTDGVRYCVEGYDRLLSVIGDCRRFER